jgi:hypothetical protein
MFQLVMLAQGHLAVVQSHGIVARKPDGGCETLLERELPYFSARYVSPAGVPGMPAASAPSMDRLEWDDRRGRGMSRVAASGARSRASIMTSKPSRARCSRKTAASQAGIVGLDDSQRCRHSDRRIKGIAATREDFVSGLCGQGCALAIPAADGRGSAAQLVSGKTTIRKIRIRSR